MLGYEGDPLEYFQSDLLDKTGQRQQGHRAWEDEVRWTVQGNLTYNYPYSKTGLLESGYQYHSYLEDGDYLKLRSLSIGYNLDLSKYYIQNMRIYFTAENVFTLTGFSGIDPEVPAYYDETTGTYKSIGTAGANLYPSTRKFMFGINLTF